MDKERFEIVSSILCKLLIGNQLTKEQANEIRALIAPLLIVYSENNKKSMTEVENGTNS